MFAYNLYKNRREGLLNFNLFFSISLYCTTFIYPVFIYNTSERYFSMFSYSFNEEIITYSTAVAYMAYCFLQLGLNNKVVQASQLRPNPVCDFDVTKVLSFLSTLFFIFLLYFLLNGGRYGYLHTDVIAV